MKNLTFLYKSLLGVALSVAIISCSDDDDGAVSTAVDFAGIASTVEEGEAGTYTIPLRGATASELENLEVSFGGTAIEGEDFTLAGITAEGVQLAIVNDNLLEGNKVIRVELTSPNLALNGNNIHNVTLTNDCEDYSGLAADYFTGDFVLVENYLEYGTYGPYHGELTQDEANPNLIYLDNFYDNGCEAEIVLDISAMTAQFVNGQIPCTAPASLATEQIANSTGTINFCAEDNTTFTINLEYDGLPWVYEFTKVGGIDNTFHAPGY